MIIFESSTGLDDNSGAFCDYIIENSKKRYKIIWMVRDPKKFRHVKYKDMKFYKIKDIRFIYYLCRAKYLIYSNVGIPKLKKQQLSIYLTHGSPPLKNIKGLINVDADLCITPSETLFDLISYQFSINKDKLFTCGLPRNDYLFKPSDAFAKFINKKFDKFFIWMPTFRKVNSKYMERNDSKVIYNFGLPLIQNIDDYYNLNKALKKINSLLVIKIHYFQDNSIQELNNLSNIILLTNDDLFENNVNLYSLLGGTDALISDYSSVIFDYLLIDKPIGFVLDDINEYSLGFSIDNPLDFMPGEKIYTFEDLLTFINHVHDGVDEYKEERKRVRDYTNKYQDGNNCERLLKFLNL